MVSILRGGSEMSKPITVDDFIHPEGDQMVGADDLKLGYFSAKKAFGEIVDKASWEYLKKLMEVSP